MMDQAFSAPLAFWVAVGVLAMLILEGLRQWNAPWAKPALVVYGTVGVWYLGDYLLSRKLDYQRFQPDIIQFGFYQVAAFLILVRVIFPMIVRETCRGLSLKSTHPQVSQHTLARCLGVLTALWALLFIISVVVHHGTWLPLLWPPAETRKVGMFVHPGVGSGTAFLLATASYIHVLTCAMMGPIAVLGRGKVRTLAIAMICIAWPYFFFDRVRNSMLALLLPAVATYWSFGQQLLMKALTSVALLAFTVFWFQQVMAYRGSGTRDLSVFTESNQEVSAVQGLDMFKELCWINTFIDNGHYQVNWGARYFAEAVNWVPRSLWAGKPMIGLDYAAARGFLAADRRSVNATIATGMIGQGVVNFGPYLGVLAAASLMAAWIGLLARLWLQQDSLWRILLFLLGIGLTFNLGRDITLLVLFPFVFGYIGVRFLERHEARKRQSRRAAPLPPMAPRASSL
jgi:hypothetical protein